MINRLKKLVLTAALILPFACHSVPAYAATEVDIKVEWCDLLETIGFQTGYCRPELTIGTPTNPTSSSVSITVTTDRDGSGTLYAYPTTSCGTAPSEATMRASTRTYSVVSDTIAATIDDLTPSTTGYCVWFAQDWERRMSEVVKSTTFNTSAGSTPGTTPPGIYVKNGDGCSNSNDGSDDANAVCSLATARTLHDTTGEDVYLKLGSSWQERYVFPVGGTATDPAELSCYKMVEGLETRCDVTDFGTEAIADFTTNSLPRIKGPTTDACIAAKTCDFVTGALPYTGQVDITNKNYTKISFIQTEYTLAGGIHIGSSNTNIATNEGSLLRPTVEYVRLYNIGTSAIPAENGVKNLHYNHVYAYKTGVCTEMVTKATVPDFGRSDCKKNGTWGGTFPVVRSPNSDSLIENSIAFRNYGETFSCYLSDHVVFRGVKSSNPQSSFYSDNGSDCVFENGILVGTQGLINYPTSSNYGNQPSINAEAISLSLSHTSHNNIFRNMLVIDTGNGFVMRLEPASQVAGVTSAGSIYHSTIVSPVQAGLNINVPNPYTATPSEAYNNIIWDEDSDAGPCFWSSSNTLFKMGPNVWYGKPVLSRCVVAGAKVVNPNLSQNVYSVYDTYDYATFPDATIAKLRAGSDAGFGASTYPLITKCLAKEEFTYVLSLLPEVDPDKWEYCALLDFNGEERNINSIPFGIFKSTL